MKEFHTGGVATGRFTNLAPEMQFLSPLSETEKAELRQKLPTGDGAKIVVESTPGFAGADFLEIEKRIMAQMGVPRWIMGKSETYPTTYCVPGET